MGYAWCERGTFPCGIRILGVMYTTYVFTNDLAEADDVLQAVRARLAPR